VARCLTWSVGTDCYHRAVTCDEYTRSGLSCQRRRVALGRCCSVERVPSLRVLFRCVGGVLLTVAGVLCSGRPVAVGLPLLGRSACVAEIIESRAEYWYVCHGATRA